MIKIQFLKARVTERLSAAADDIFVLVETDIEEFPSATDLKLHTVSVKVETPPETEISAVVQLRRRLINERLTAAAEEILMFLEGMLSEYEKEASLSKHTVNCQPKQELNIKAEPHLVAPSVCKEEPPSEEQERNPRQDQEQPEPPQIKEEQEENQTSQDDIVKVTLLPITFEFIHNQDGALSLHFTPTGVRADTTTLTKELEMDGEGHRLSEPARDLANLEDEGTGDICNQKESGEPPLSVTTQTSAKRPYSLRPKRNKSARLSPPPKAAGPSHIPLFCKLCGKSFFYKGFLINHVQRHGASAQLCGVCGKTPENGTTLAVHLQKHAEAKETEACHICGKQFGTVVGLERHVGAHARGLPYKCPVCGKGFNHSGHLKTHARTHTGEKPFVCSVCGKAYTQNGNLVAHMRGHTGEKPYACTICGKAFHRRGLLQTHARIHTGDKPYTCDVCGKGFSDSTNFKRHTMAHTGEQPHSCGLCGKAFKQKQHLKYHMANHKGQKPFKCEVCWKGFVLENDLRRHAKTHAEKGSAATP